MEPLWWCPPQLMGPWCVHESCKSSTSDEKPPQNVTAVTVQQQEWVQPRAVPVLSVGAGRGAAGIEGFWVPSSLFHHQAILWVPWRSKSIWTQSLLHREMGSRCPACARWEWARWSLEAPSNLNHSTSSVISKKTEATDMWKIPQGVWNMALPLYLMTLSYYLEF